MKKLVIAAAIACMTSNAFAAATVRARVQEKTPAKVGTGGKVTGQQGISTSTTRSGVMGAGSQSQSGKETILDTAVTNALKTRMTKEECAKDSGVAGMNSAELIDLTDAKADGLSSTACLTKLAGDKVVAGRARRMIGSGEAVFQGLKKSGKISDRNNDGKLTIADASDAQKGLVIDGYANVIESDLNLSESVAIDRVQATKEEGHCDFVSEELGTSAAFQEARTNGDARF